MQVKKFEARTMKEALEMVKTQLGPDAIILSARDNKRSFGLVGEGSVEITAAVSEETLQKKRLAEAKMREQDRQVFAKSPARAQKEYINKVVSRAMQEKQVVNRPTTNTRYIEIDDEFDQSDVADMGNAGERIKRAAQAAWDAMNEVAPPVAKPQARIAPVTQALAKVLPVPERVPQTSPDVTALQSEIASLRSMLAQVSQSVQAAGAVSAQPQQAVKTYPGSEYDLPYDVSFLFEKLVHEGISHELTAVMLEQAVKEIPSVKLKNRSLVEGWMARHILETTQIADPSLNSKIHVFVGPSGSGKTSSMVKMASHLVVREKKKIALFTTDTKKVGAAEQMKIYAQILNVPFAIIRGPQDWQNVMRYLQDLDIVLVDSSGTSLKSAEDIEELQRLLPPQNMRPRVHFVANASTKDQDLIELGRRFSAVGYQDVIFSGLDESSIPGSIYNFMRRFDIPLHSFGIGSRIPEDFEFATRERVLDLIMKITRRKENEVGA